MFPDVLSHVIVAVNVSVKVNNTFRVKLFYFILFIFIRCSLGASTAQRRQFLDYTTVRCDCVLGLCKVGALNVCARARVYACAIMTYLNGVDFPFDLDDFSWKTDISKC